ncbi:hypothetical protein LCDV1gp021 [Lymphocystis disease virus 1]|uniref:hypothetical protein n=1 Tax=Fish lymphocystis disease virus TaxID=36363 RepID=UPI0000161EA8|nr:hypothetical protein LCDV1gp021 [Lymphocystis disease virus 1]
MSVTIDVLGKGKKKHHLKTKKPKAIRRINENLYQKVSIALDKSKNVLAAFSQFNFTEMKEGLLQVPLRINEDADLTRLFFHLNRFIPAQLTDAFFKEYNSQKFIFKPWTYFKNIFEPKHIDIIKEAQLFISSRKAVPAKFKIKPIKQIEFLRKMAKTGSISQKEKILQDELAARMNVLSIFKGRPQKFMTAEQSVALYRAAPWLIAFTNKPVKAILLAKDAPSRDTIDRTIKDEKGKEWHFATARWYRESWTNGRKFRPDYVAYYLKDKSVLIENSDVFNALQKYELSFFEKNSTVKAVINKFALKALFNFYSDLSEKYTNDLINYLATRYKDQPIEFENKGITTVTYLLPIFFKNRQPIHQTRFSREQYDYSTVANITKEQAFAEVYTDPQHNLKERLDQVLAARIDSMRAEYKLLINPTYRTTKATIDYRLPPVNVFPTDLPSNDYVVFNTREKVRIFMDRKTFLSEPNLHTETNALHLRFIKTIKDPQHKIKPIEEDQTIALKYTGFYLTGTTPPLLKQIPAKYLAPNLMNKLRRYLNNLTAQKTCKNCDAVIDIKDALKTMDNVEIVYYCGANCLLNAEE